MSKILLFLVIISVIVAVFMGGIAVGAYYFSNLNPKLRNAEADANIVKILKSQSIDQIEIYGTVSSINDKVITINSGKDEIKIMVSDKARIFLHIPETGGLDSKMFSDIKPGEKITAATVLQENGELSAFSIIIDATK